MTAITLQTPNHFADLRVPTAMSPALLCAGSLGELSPTQLLELASIQSFGGVSFVRYDVEGYIGEAVCERLHAIDWHPPPRLYPNKWRIQLLPEEKGGWVEWGVRKDRHGQAAYVEHWRRLPQGSAAAYLVLRRRGPLRDALLLVVDDHFLLLDDRPGGGLQAVKPGKAGHPPDRGSLVVLAEQALRAATSSSETQATAAAAAPARPNADVLFGVVSCYGRVSTGWTIELSSWPWLQGRCLFTLGNPLQGQRQLRPAAEQPGLQHQQTPEERTSDYVLFEERGIGSAAELLVEGHSSSFDKLSSVDVEWNVEETSLSRGQLRTLLLQAHHGRPPPALARV